MRDPAGDEDEWSQGGGRQRAGSCGTRRGADFEREFRFVAACAVVLSAATWCSSVHALFDHADSVVGTLIAAGCTCVGVWLGSLVISRRAAIAKSQHKAAARARAHSLPHLPAAGPMEDGHPRRDELARKAQRYHEDMLAALRKAQRRGTHAVNEAAVSKADRTI